MSEHELFIGYKEDELCHIECDIVARDTKTISITLYDDIEKKNVFILPVDKIRDNRDGTITMPMWLALNKGISYD